MSSQPSDQPKKANITRHRPAIPTTSSTIRIFTRRHRVSCRDYSTSTRLHLSYTSRLVYFCRKCNKNGQKVSVIGSVTLFFNWNKSISHSSDGTVDAANHAAVLHAGSSPIDLNRVEATGNAVETGDQVNNDGMCVLYFWCEHVFLHL